MKRRWTLAVLVAGFLLMGSRGICRQTVTRPVVRFIDFYKAAQQAERPLSVMERITYGLVIAAHDDVGEGIVSRGS